MADNKTYSPREVALAVLAKAQELLVKAELEKAPTKVAEHQSGMHTVGYYSTTPFEKSESLDFGFEPFQEMQKAEKGVHGEVGGRSDSGMSHAGSHARDAKEFSSPKSGELARGKHKQVLGELTSMPKPSLPKSENPDAKQDAQLGEQVEGLCERHMLDNKDAERKEGHKIVKSEMCKNCKSENMHKAEFADIYEALSKVEALEKAEKPGENEIGTKFVPHMDKAEGQGSGIKKEPSDEMKHGVAEEQAPQRDASNFETQPGHASKPADHREEQQTAPGTNPKEQAEGNNPPAGSDPAAKTATGAISGKGVHKLSHFCGHLKGKKSMNKGIALG